MKQNETLDTVHVARIVDLCLERLLTNDRYLLIHNVSERAITHRLAVYLEQTFLGWHVDCEYNRNVDAVKRIHRIIGRKLPEDDVYPDIIVHRRGNHESNLLAIEVKKANNLNTDWDIAKLLAYRREYHYQHALYLVFETGKESAGVKTIEWL
jgi:hypothetical protein